MADRWKRWSEQVAEQVDMRNEMEDRRQERSHRGMPRREPGLGRQLALKSLARHVTELCRERASEPRQDASVGSAIGGAQESELFAPEVAAEARRQIVGVQHVPAIVWG